MGLPLWARRVIKAAIKEAESKGREEIRNRIKDALGSSNIHAN